MKKYIYLAVILFLSISFFAIGYVISGLKFLPPHHHANFSVFIDDKQIDFSAEKYMEDIAGCSLGGKVYPKDRVHLHENDGDSIHVHSDGVSWEHFFSNLGFTFGPDFIYSTSSGMLLGTETKKLSFILNGESVDFPLKELIHSEENLMISFGNEDEKTLLKRYGELPIDAAEYNQKYDPGSCSGTNQNATLSLLKDMVSFGHSH